MIPAESVSAFSGFRLLFPARTSSVPTVTVLQAVAGLSRQAEKSVRLFETWVPAL
jgi:hypothetical protein